MSAGPSLRKVKEGFIFQVRRGFTGQLTGISASKGKEMGWGWFIHFPLNFLPPCQSSLMHVIAAFDGNSVTGITHYTGKQCFFKDVAEPLITE